MLQTKRFCNCIIRCVSPRLDPATPLHAMAMNAMTLGISTFYSIALGETGKALEANSAVQNFLILESAAVLRIQTPITIFFLKTPTNDHL